MTGPFTLGLLVLAGCGSVSGTPIDARPIDSPPITTDASPDSAVPFSPSQLTGLVLWLDAGQSVMTTQSKVSTWMDRSGKNNGAAQAVAALQPTLVTGVINGHPVVRFDGTSNALQITDSATLQWGTDDFLIAMVASYKNPATGTYPYGLMYSKQSTTAPYPGPSLWANYTQPMVSTVFALQTAASMNAYAITSDTGYNDGVARLYVGRRHGGTNLEVRVNGVVKGTATAASPLDVDAAGLPAYIGGAVGANNTVIQGLDGDIAEVIAIHGPITAAELAELEAYLETKYGF